MARPLLLGIEIGGTKLQVGLGHGNGSLLQLRRAVIDPKTGAQGVLAQVIEEADRVCWAHNVGRESIEAVGIGFGGPVDADQGIVLKSHHVAGWDGFEISEWVRRTLGVETVSVQNDADTAGLAEARFGAGKGRSPLLYVTIGSGIGGGLILDGRIYRGAGLGALEIGHLWVNPPEEGMTEGETVEQAASGWSIARRAREILESRQPGAETLRDLVDGDPAGVTAEVVAMAASFGDTAVRAILDHATRSLALGLANAVTLLAPERIILGGGVSLMGEEQWFAPIRNRLERLAFPPFRGRFDVVPAALGEGVVVQGALVLAREALAET
ncbi:ROK family protein [soil metagenome]